MAARSKRRDFLRQAALGAAGLGVTCAAGAYATPPKDRRLFHISLAEWSLHRALFSRRLDHLDFAAAAKNEYGIGAVEYVNQFFMERAGDRKYLAEMKKRARDLGVRSLLIMVDGEGALGDPDAAKRKRAVENHYKWVEAARFLGCHSIRVNAHSGGSSEEQLGLAAEGLRSLSDFAAPFRVNVIVENHGGVSSNGAWLAAVLRRVGRMNCGSLPDFGNFDLGGGERYDRYQGVREMMPFARAVSAKSHDFDARGDETRTDYRRMLKIVLGAGYRGFLGIEYEGERMSEPDGIRATKTLLERIRGEFHKGVRI